MEFRDGDPRYGDPRAGRPGRLTLRLFGTAVAALLLCSCGSGGADELGDSVAASVPLLAELDWSNASYSSACGLSNVAVRGGVGEAATRGDIFGMEVVDVAVGDLDGVPGDEAAVLVDCLGADSYRPHVMVVGVGGVTGSEPITVTAETGGSVAPGDRPLAIDIGGGGEIRVTVADRDREVVHRLEHATHVLRGGELPAEPGSSIHGVLAAVEQAEFAPVLVVAVGPDDGYRIPATTQLVSVDPENGRAVAPHELLGRGVQVALDESGTVTELVVVPAGGA